MLTPELLSILCCPETHQELSVAEREVVERLNLAASKGTLRNRAGGLVGQPLESALVRSDRRFAYPIRNGIPVLLVDEGLDLQQIN